MLTLKKVKEMVKAPVHTKRVPSPKVLLEDGRILLRKEFEHDSHLTLYHSGYVWFSAGKRNTVFHIHDCRGDYAYGASKGKGEVIKEEYFENCEWHIRALFEGEQRVEESQLKCEGVGQTKVSVSYHAVAEDWGEMADSEINVLDSRFDNFDKAFRLSIKGAWNYSMEVGKDPQGNILRVTNALAGIERALPQVERRLETLEQQLAQAKEEAKRPFAQEAELAEKSARLAELNSLLNMDEKGSEDTLGVDEDAAETEVADRPRQPVNYAGRVAERTADNVRKPSVLAQLHAKQAEHSAEPQKSQKRKSHDMEL